MWKELVARRMTDGRRQEVPARAMRLFLAMFYAFGCEESFFCHRQLRGMEWGFGFGHGVPLATTPMPNGPPETCFNGRSRLTRRNRQEDQTAGEAGKVRSTESARPSQRALQRGCSEWRLPGCSRCLPHSRRRSAPPRPTAPAPRAALRTARTTNAAQWRRARRQYTILRQTPRAHDSVPATQHTRFGATASEQTKTKEEIHIVLWPPGHPISDRAGPLAAGHSHHGRCKVTLHGRIRQESRRTPFPSQHRDLVPGKSPNLHQSRRLFIASVLGRCSCHAMRPPPWSRARSRLRLPDAAVVGFICSKAEKPERSKERKKK